MNTPEDYARKLHALKDSAEHVGMIVGANPLPERTWRANFQTKGERRMSDVVKRGDAQQYEAEPHSGDPDAGVLPTVKLLWITPDPLGAVASFNAIYSGRVVRSLDDVSDDDRMQALIDVQKTHLQAPLEAIKLHFLIEGVDRAFTHQLVRQRTAVYAQESMRFAVLGDLIDATTLPPSLAGTHRQGDLVVEGADLSLNELRTSLLYDMATEEQRQRMVWDWTINNVDKAYHLLVETGMPAEEARGLLPHATATRIHFITDMRNLKDHAGNRLCTQAQFHWRLVFAQMMQEIRNYGNNDANCYTLPDGSCVGSNCMHSPDRWQFQAIADSALWRPVCYQIGHCPFQASFDRACKIREKVEVRARHGSVDSSQWHKPFIGSRWDPNYKDDGIHTHEWLADPAAARL